MFQSTRPAWGATCPGPATRLCTAVSIHAPRVGRDTFFAGAVAFLNLFQSTRPAWGATMQGDDGQLHYVVSIHAPRVGRDDRSPAR